MKLLAIDTSSDMATVALLVGEEITTQVKTGVKTHAQFLLPMVETLLQEADVSLPQLDGIVFGCGPGSFTGLRIACSVAKGLACAHDLGLIPISSLDAIAYALRAEKKWADYPLLALLDARMQQLYWAYYPPHIQQGDAQVSNADKISLPADLPLVMAGLGIDAYWDDFAKPMQQQVVFRKTCHPEAKNMLALARALGVKPIDPALAEPVYVRNQIIQSRGESNG